MLNLSNETDYKSITNTKNYYNLFIFAILILFTAIFIRLIYISLDNKSNFMSISKNEYLKILPTIYDFNKNILAYSDYNYSIIDNKINLSILKEMCLSIT